MVGGRRSEPASVEVLLGRMSYLLPLLRRNGTRAVAWPSMEVEDLVPTLEVEDRAMETLDAELDGVSYSQSWNGRSLVERRRFLRQLRCLPHDGCPNLR